MMSDVDGKKSGDGRRFEMVGLMLFPVVNSGNGGERRVVGESVKNI